MKKIGTVFFILVMMLSAFLVTVYASGQTETDAVNYYDESGNLITVDGLYYNTRGLPCFNADCYYYDDDGNPVYVGGCRAYCYDTNGSFVPCRYYFDDSGDPVNPPVRSSQRYGRGGGCCSGRTVRK